MEHAVQARESADRLSSEARRDFAVVIPALNEAPMVPDLIAELKATFKRFELDGEILVVDDGSTDGTGDLVEKEAEAIGPVVAELRRLGHEVLLIGLRNDTSATKIHGGSTRIFEQQNLSHVELVENGYTGDVVNVPD